jgi:hypothetical protein
MRRPFVAVLALLVAVGAYALAFVELADDRLVGLFWLAFGAVFTGAAIVNARPGEGR